MKTKQLHELRSIAKDKGLRGFYKLKKADLLSLWLEQSSEEMPTSAPRSKGKERRPLLPVKIIPSPQEMDEFEKEELKKSTPVVKNRLSELYDSIFDYVPRPTKKAVKKSFLRVKNSAMSLYDGAKKTLKGIVERQAEEGQQQEIEDVDLTKHEHGRTLKVAYKSFVMPGSSKTDIDNYFDQAKPHIRTLIEIQLKDIGSVKIIMTLSVVWKKPIKLLIRLDPEDAKNAQDLDNGTVGDICYEKIEMPFHSLMTEFFDASDINDLVEHMLAYIKWQTENPKFVESGFTLDKIMHLYINFHRLVLTRGSS